MDVQVYENAQVRHDLNREAAAGLESRVDLQKATVKGLGLQKDLDAAKERIATLENDKVNLLIVLPCDSERNLWLIVLPCDLEGSPAALWFKKESCLVVQRKPVAALCSLYCLVI